MKLERYLTVSGYVWKDTWFQTENKELLKLCGTLTNNILELKCGENIPIFEVYTSFVYPRTVQWDDQSCILWDNHFWRLYGHFIYSYNADYDDTENNANRLITLKSLQLLFLTSRFEKTPALSRFIAEEYKQLNYRIPSHSESDDIISKLKQCGKYEEFNIGCIFGYCHEIAHIAVRQNNNLALMMKNVLIHFCETVITQCELCGQYSRFIEEEGHNFGEETFEYEYKTAKRVLDNKDGAILEEICCDLIAIYTIVTYLEFQGKNNEQIVDTLGYISAFFLFTWWLSSNEKFWDTLRKIYEHPVENDNAYVDENNQYYGFGERITEETAVRLNFSIAVFSHYSTVSVKSIHDKHIIQFRRFTEFSDELNGYDVLERVLTRYSVSKKDYISKKRHKHKRDTVLGW